MFDYDNKFNYKKGYLRDDKVPAFISTKINQSNKKELDAEKIYDESSKANIGVINKQSSMNSASLI